MFFEDQIASLTEMWRVIKPGGRVVVADWDSLENSPGDLAFANLLERLFGENVANELKATYALGDEQKLLSLFENTGIHHPQITTTEQTTCYPSVESWMQMDVEGWTMSDPIDDEGYARRVAAACVEMEPFTQSDGRVAFPSQAHIASARKEP